MQYIVPHSSYPIKILQHPRKPGLRPFGTYPFIHYCLIPASVADNHGFDCYAPASIDIRRLVCHCASLFSNGCVPQLYTTMTRQCNLDLGVASMATMSSEVLSPQVGTSWMVDCCSVSGYFHCPVPILSPFE
jgi:hypothetical protein